MPSSSGFKCDEELARLYAQVFGRMDRPPFLYSWDGVTDRWYLEPAYTTEPMLHSACLKPEGGGIISIRNISIRPQNCTVSQSPYYCYV